MNSARLLSVLAASSLAGIALAQNQTAPSSAPSAQSSTPPPTAPAAAPAPGYNTANPSSASSPHQRSVTGMQAHEAPPNPNPGPTAAASPHQKHAMRMAEANSGGGQDWSNMTVESPSGQSLGSVSSVVPGLNGQTSSGYVVVAGANGNSVPVPYRTASSMVRDGKLVLSPSRLEHAPKVTQEDLQNSADHAWRAKADRYWMRRGRGGKPQAP
jgi:hypothetical protein